MKFVENLSEKEYKEFSNKHQKSHFLQSYEWAMFSKKAKNQIPRFVGLKDDKNKLVATALIMEKQMPFGYKYGYSPRGFLIDYSNKELIKTFTEELRKYIKNNKYIYVRFDPDIKYQDIDENANPIENGDNNYELYKYMLSLGYKHTGFWRLYDGNQPRYTFRINLKRPWEEIESRISKSFMKSIKRSDAYDLEIDNEVNTKEFYRLMVNNSMKDGFNSHSLEYYQAFTDAFKDSGNMKFFNSYIYPKKLVKKIDEQIKSLNEELEKSKKHEADIKNQLSRLEKEKEEFSKIDEDKLMVCSLICTYTKNRAWSLFIGSDELANLTFSVSRCYYEAIKDAYEHGYEFFDLFGTSGDPNTKYKNLAKLHDFKRKFGDEYIEFIGEFDLVNKKFLYKILPILLKVYRKIRK